MRAVSLLPPVLLLAGFACRTATEPAIEAKLTVSVEAVVASSATWGARVEVPATLRNEGHEDLYLFPCNQELQKEVESTWQAVWSAGCTLLPGQQVRIKPGEQYTMLVSATAQTGSLRWPPVQVPGLYRLAVAVNRNGKPGTAVVVSGPFTVEF